MVHAGSIDQFIDRLWTPDPQVDQKSLLDLGQEVMQIINLSGLIFV